MVGREKFALMWVGLLFSVGVWAGDQTETLGRIEIPREFEFSLDPKTLKALAAEANVKENVFLDIPVRDRKGNWASVLLGPCRWTAYGERIDHNDRQVEQAKELLRVPVLTEEEIGYKIGLRCKEDSANRFEITFGLSQNATEIYTIDGHRFGADGDEDRGIFLQFVIRK